MPNVKHNCICSVGLVNKQSRRHRQLTRKFERVDQNLPSEVST